MQEIKIRIWDTEDNKMVDGFNFDCITYFDNAGRLFCSDGFELMRFTGLLDKDGREIYEGDVLGKDGFWSFYVGFTDACFVMIPCDKVQRLNWTWHPIGQEKIAGWEVIGNIHEHGELLKD